MRKRPGPKPKRGSGVSHHAREAIDGRTVHVTVKLREGLPKLRNKRAYRTLREAFVAGCNRFGFRLCHYTVQNNHLHLIVEGDDRRAVSRGLQGLLIRIAKGLNRLWGRRGRVFRDRYHDRVLKNAKEIRRVLAYVLNNARRHRVKLPWPVDLFSSAPWFNGWSSGHRYTDLVPDVPRPVTDTRVFDLLLGWRRFHLIDPSEIPGPTIPPEGLPP